MVEPAIRAALPADDVGVSLDKRWGAETMAVHGRLYDTAGPDVLIGTTGDRLVGVLTYVVEDDARE